MRPIVTNLDTAKIRKQLLMEKQQILQSVQGDSGVPLHMNPDRDDLAQDYITLEKDVAIKAIEREQLEQIDLALERLERGTYGLCQECRQPIPPARLEILPYALLCVRCQSKQERRW
jgi:RNA polymerase-binding protein DksA